MIAAFNGNRDHCNGVLTFQFKKAAFEFEDEVPWTLDGEDGGNVQNSEISVIPERITVFVPKKK